MNENENGLACSPGFLPTPQHFNGRLDYRFHAWAHCPISTLINYLYIRYHGTYVKPCFSDRAAKGPELQDQRYPVFVIKRERERVRETRLLSCWIRRQRHQLPQGALHRWPLNRKRERETRFQCPSISETGYRTPVQFKAPLQEGLC